MKRVLSQRLAAHWLRTVATLSSLVNTQNALQNNTRVSTAAATEFTAFCGFARDASGSPTPAGKSRAHRKAKAAEPSLTVEKKLQTVFAGVVDALKVEAESSATRSRNGQSGQSDALVIGAKAMELPVFLIALDKRRGRLLLYSVTHDKCLQHEVDVRAQGEAWALSDEVMGLTNGEQQFILLPVADTEKDRTALTAPLHTLTQQLCSCGLLPVAHVDTLEVSTALVKNPPSFRSLITQVGGYSETTADKLTPASLPWFRARWTYLRTLACQSTTADPLQTISTLVFPRHTVFVVHLVRAGSRSMNMSLYEPARRRRFTGKGMLSDILACLFETHAKHMILIPTNRTDRALLYRCRTALHKMGHVCTIAFASEVDEKYRKAYSSEPSRYWSAMKEITKALDADLLSQFRIASGNQMRAYRIKVVQATELRSSRGGSGGNPPDQEQDPDGDGEHGGGEADIHRPSGEVEVVSQTNVEAWLQQFQLPARQLAERKEVQHYQKYLVMSYISGNVLDRGQPCNPLSPLNFVVAACLRDSDGHVLEPWTKYTQRGDFKLPSLESYDVLVLHDAKHFIVHQWHDDELRRFLARGGRVWCTMLAEYLLSAQRQRTGHISLNDVALRHGHLLPPQTKLGVTNAQLPLSFLRTHLVSATPALVAVFQEQVRSAVVRSQMISLAHRMDSLLAMAAMEVAGIFVDTQEATRQALTWKTAAVSLDRALDAHTPLEVPVDMRRYFDWHSLTHMHAYFFGGTVSIGQGTRARHSALWTSNLVHLCHAYGPFAQMVGEIYLQQFATQCRLSFQGSTRLPQAIAQYITSHGTDKQKKYRVVLFDLETTGLNVFTDEIVEVAFYDPVEKTSFSSLVRPARRITPRTTGIHHITDAMVRDAPPIEAVTGEIVTYLRLDSGEETRDEITLLIGHNVFGLDEPMLRRALDRFYPDTAHDGILYCDSLVLLQALRQELSSTSRTNRKAEKGLLDVLTSTLRLGSLVEQLKVQPEGAMHRAETDTKALWSVLLTAFGLKGKSVTEQRDAILAECARSLLTYPSAGCFVPTVRKSTALQVQLPGVAHEAVANGKTVKQLAAKPISEETLRILNGHGVAAAGLLLQRQRLQQHTTNFLQPSDDGRALTTVHPDHAVHQHIDMTATTTSRTTSLYPSCQNIPKDDKSAVRRLFASRFGASGRCVEVDYSQLEIVVLAILCRDPQLVKDLNSGVDFHIKRAAFFSGLPYEEIYEGYQRRVPKYVALRKTAKQFSFQRLYGAGIPLLHKTTGISPKNLEASIAAEDKEYPGIAAFHRLVRSVALRPNNPGLPTGLLAEMPTGLQLNFRSRDVVLNLPPMKNYPIQGYGAELAQIMLGRLMRHLLATNFYRDRAFLVNFVHDSVWLDCHVDVLSEVVADTCRILSDVHRYVPAAFPGVTIDVPLHVTASYGVNMCEMHDQVDSTDVPASSPASLSPAKAKKKSKSAVGRLKNRTSSRPKSGHGKTGTSTVDVRNTTDDSQIEDDSVQTLLDDAGADFLGEAHQELNTSKKRTTRHTPIIVHL